MLLAAAERLGDAALLSRAADRLSLEPGALAPPTEAGLLEIDDRIRFRRPLVRSAVYRAASPPNDVTETTRLPRRRSRAPPTAARGTAGPRLPNGRIRGGRTWNAAQDAHRAQGGLAAAAAFSIERRR